MSVLSERLAFVRKERDIAQKTAAKDLGVSQALLSHYEKGIRECSPTFLAAAAAYYDVSADYLLGLSDRQRSSPALFTDDETSSDADPTPETVFRAMARIFKECSEASRPLAARVLTVYEYSLYGLVRELSRSGFVLNLPYEISAADAEFYLSVASGEEMRKIRALASQLGALAADSPKCVATTVKISEETIKAAVNNLSAE